MQLCPDSRCQVCVLVMKKPTVNLVVTKSVTRPTLLSLRLCKDEPSASSLKKALVDAGFKDGDLVTLTLTAQ